MNIFDLLIVQPLFNLLILLYAVIPGGDFGISIIIFTILFRLAMWPLVKRQLHHTKLIKKLQPELERIKKQTKGNKQQYSVQMLDLYKRNGVNPFRPIGIILIQLPIFFGLFFVIQIFTTHLNEVGKYTYDFLEKLDPIKELITHPENFNETLLGIVNLTSHAVSKDGINIFLILLAAVAAVMQYIMSKQTAPTTTSNKKLREIMAEAAEGKEADQSEINAVVMGKMIKVLPFFMFLVMINLPGALTLYYAVSNIVAVIQQHYILKQDEEELEEIAGEAPKASGKKATAKARAKAANEATVTRIVAKGSTPAKKSKKGGGA